MTAAFAAGNDADARRYASIVVDANTGRILHGENIDRRVYPASLTKMMTLYMTFEALQRGQLKLNQRLKVSRRAAGQTPSRLGLRAGQRITVKDAILAMITKSANDAATVLAEGIAGSEAKFAKRMTAKARSLGMLKTTFRNASGLPNRRQLTTARDMARLSRALLDDYQAYYRYFSTKRFTFGKRTHRNHNTLLSTYQGTDGIKTGYIRASGFNVAVSVQRDGERLIGVVFGGRTATTRNKHAVKLLNKGFGRLAARERAKSPRQYESRWPLLDAPLPKPNPNRVKPPVRTAKAGPGTATSGPSVPTPPSRPVVANARQWGVQVGAFSALHAAQNAAYQAAAVTKLATNRNVKVVRVANHNGAVYRAWLARLNEGQARQLCNELIAKQMPCALVLPNGEVTFKLAAQ